jgi:hypothetical protein
MPSAEHESPIALAKLQPDIVAWLLLNVFSVKLPDYHHARPHATDVKVMAPSTYHADGMVVFCDDNDKPKLAVVMEVQRSWDGTKRRRWKLYVAHLEDELDVTAALLVYCPKPAIARRYRRLFESDGLSLVLQPFIFTPQEVPIVLDDDAARSNPALAVLSAICHGGHAEVDAMFPAVSAALDALGPREGVRYYDVVLAALPSAARVRWEAFMTTDVRREYHSELFQELAARHEARGEAVGEARGEARGVAKGEGLAVLTVLQDARGSGV